MAFQNTRLGEEAERRGCDLGLLRGRTLAFNKTQQTRVYPLGAGSARPNPKMGAPDPESPLLKGFSVLRGVLGPWSQTMVSEGARPWGRGRSGDRENIAILSLQFRCFPQEPTKDLRACLPQGLKQLGNRRCSCFRAQHNWKCMQYPGVSVLPLA